ncbi:hypothetical protein Bca4012_084234 [Brassica carinata]|uniref:GTD-binding domain-containing protein n=1 Tax=Brassica carinata TaxID=52824 RepID=A0A8X7SI44_BRACI|nr:hypothetical protein Bca52824_026546 [Brassica carinata]
MRCLNFLSLKMPCLKCERFLWETMTHEQEKVSALEELVYEKEKAIEALYYEVKVYKDRLLSYGITEAEMHDQIDSSTVGIDDYPCDDYTSLKCSVYDENLSGLDGDVEVVEKVMVGQSSLGTAKEVKGTFYTDSPMSTSNDRVYTIDSIHVGDSEVKIDDELSKGKLKGDHWKSQRYQEPKLYTRLQALEADRESLRQVILAMRTDQAQLVLLKEIAQHLSKETVTTKGVNPVRKMLSLRAFSVGTVFKWIVSFVSWRRKAKQNKYVYNLSANNMGMLMILGEGCRTRR